MHYLSIDIGTTGGKVLLFSEQMEQKQSYYADYPTYHNGTEEQAEHDPADWWRVCKDGIRAVLTGEGITGDQVAGIGMSCMTPVVLALDGSGQPLTRAWLWYDQRAASMLPAICTAFAPGELEQLCGADCKTNSFLTKLLYLRRTQPQVYAKTAAFLQANGYLIYRLTGQLTLDSSHGELLHLVDCASGGYCDRVFDGLSLDREKFPRLVQANAIAGLVSEAAAAETGLRAGTPVVSGGHDSALAAYTFCLDSEGKACLDIGSAANLVMASSSAVFCPAADVYRYPEPGKWLFQIYSTTIGTALRWFTDAFCPDLKQEAAAQGMSVYDVVCRRAAQAQPGAGGLLFYPCLQGAQQCGQLSGSFRGVRLGHGRNEFIRALLEGCAMSVRYNKEQMERASGLCMMDLVCCGGGSRSPFWLQIFADVLGCPIQVKSVSEAAATGAAILAYSAICGKRPHWAAKTLRTVLPNQEASGFYDQVYARFRDGFERQIAEFK